MTDYHELEDLIDRHLHGELDERDQERLAEWLDTEPAARKLFIQHVHWDTELGEAVREEPASNSEGQEIRSGSRQDFRPSSGGSAETPDEFRCGHAAQLTITAEKTSTGSNRLLHSLLALSLIVIAGLATVLIQERSQAPEEGAAAVHQAIPSIARITGLSGSLIWTGDRGEIVRDIAVGTELAGGTIEGMAPDSWFELQFHDGSEVMISGNSMLTFADAGQKVLRLREGRLSADVQPQPDGKPMLIHTRTALLQVLGTRLDIEAGLASTSLNVSEGKVRIRRLSDGSEVDVPADHHVVADDEQEFTPTRTSASVNDWKTDFQSKPGNYGKWRPASDNHPASLKAIPLVVPHAPKVTLQLAGVSVKRSDGSPVVVAAGSRFRLKGHIRLDVPVYFGIRVNHENGEFAGMFRGDLQKAQPPTQRDVSGVFEETYELKNFTVDPAVWEKRNELAAHPAGLVLDGVWAFTFAQPSSGLELTECELIPPE